MSKFLHNDDITTAAADDYDNTLMFIFSKTAKLKIKKKNIFLVFP